MAKQQELYEYQYTTPSKRVQKACLPAVKKPKGRSKEDGKIFWGCILQLVGFFGLMGTLRSMAGGTGFLGLASSFLVYGGMLGLGLYRVRDGRRVIGRMDRYFRYMKLLETRPYASVEELASRVAKKSRVVMEDLEYMIDRGWFMEAHLDVRRSYFMLTDKAYEQFNEAEKARLIRDREEAEKKLRESDPVQKELAQLLEEGQAYVKKIRRLNDQISGEKVSSRLYQIEDVVGSIFDQVKRRPEKMPDLRKFMRYYLPITVKAITSYRDFEDEEFPNRQLEEGKRDIEETLEKVYNAFLKLKEKLFREDVLDVATDLDVLEAMMSQEGLLAEDFQLVSEQK